jgi:hypothetical protein
MTSAEITVPAAAPIAREVRIREAGETMGGLDARTGPDDLKRLKLRPLLAKIV